jgi:hypothetical protein
MPRKKLVIEPKPMTIRKPIRRSKIVLPDIIDMEYVVTNALQDEASKSSNNLTMTDAKKIAPAVTTKVEEQVRAEMQPVIDHLTNNEPWYQSRVTWGALIAAAAGIAGLAGYTIDAEDQRFWVDNAIEMVQLGTAIAALLGGVVAWYGRKPIGE